MGIVAPLPIPHPDDIVIDLKTGSVKILGPLTKEEKVVWDRLRAVKTESREAVKEYEETLRNDPNCEHAESLREEIAHAQDLIDIIGQVIKD